MTTHFAPPVTDFSSEGFPLVGGRLDYLDNRTVSAIVYSRRKHRVNIFIWPSADVGNADPQWDFRQGFNVAHWRARGMNYWTISDLNRKELGVLVDLVNSR